jgi:hypothetical protein
VAVNFFDEEMLLTRVGLITTFSCRADRPLVIPIAMGERRSAESQKAEMMAVARRPNARRNCNLYLKTVAGLSH